MGPQPFGGGNPDSTPFSRMPTWYFNGATAFRWWKPDAVDVIIGAAKHPSMRPPPFGGGNVIAPSYPALDHYILQWGHRLSVVETTATLYHRRAFFYASMGPPPFGGGNAWRRRLYRVPLLSFNGATAFRWWKRCKGEARLPGRWHFNGATAFRWWKRGMLIPGLQAGNHTSMGPPPFGGGNPRSLRTVWAMTHLQWGHRLSVVETGQPGRQPG